MRFLVDERLQLFRDPQLVPSRAHASNNVAHKKADPRAEQHREQDSHAMARVMSASVPKHVNTGLL
jgi:hypothetical protein